MLRLVVWRWTMVYVAYVLSWCLLFGGITNFDFLPVWVEAVVTLGVAIFLTIGLLEAEEDIDDWVSRRNLGRGSRSRFLS